MLDPRSVGFATLLEVASLPFVQAILDAIPAPIFFKDSAGVYRGCNLAFEAFLGRRREEIIGRSVEEIAPPELAAIYRKADDALFENPGVQVYETAISGADGERRDVVFHKATFTDASGRVAGLVGTYSDVTERNRAERARLAGEQRLQLVLEATDQLTWDWAVRRDEVVVGSQVARLLGVAPGDVATARDALARVHPEDVPRVRELVAAQGAAGDRALELECRLRRRDGGYCWFLVVARVVEAEGGVPTRVVGTAVDVSEKKRFEERMVLADRLASLGTLAAGMAHEINNPLASVAANLEYATRTLRQLGAEGCKGVACEVADAHPALRDVRGALGDAEEGIDRVSRIVKDLRVFSHPGGDTGSIDLCEVARSASNIARCELQGRGRLTLALDPVPPVAGDAPRLGQVIVNLLVNAAQALPAAGGEVRLGTARAPDGRIALEVTDTGCGIAADALGRIFDPFFTTKPPGIGTGLGLFVCRALVAAMGGEIVVESAVGRGSTFRVLLPVATGAPAPAPASSPPRATRRAKVLVVDDEPIVGRAVARILSAVHDVTTVPSARAALDRVLAGDLFDALVCDVMMPGMTGEQLYERLRLADPRLASRTVFMTGGSFVPAVRAFLDRIENPSLVKPFQAVALANAVATVLEGGAA